MVYVFVFGFYVTIMTKTKMNSEVEERALYSSVVCLM